MAKEIYNIRQELENMRFGVKLLQKIDCPDKDSANYRKITKSGASLPDGIFEDDSTEGDTYYSVYNADLSFEEKIEYLLLKKNAYTKTIKNCVVFFTVIAVISLIVSMVVSYISII